MLRFVIFLLAFNLACAPCFASFLDKGSKTAKKDAGRIESPVGEAQNAAPKKPAETVVDVEAENVQKKDGRIEAFGNVVVTGQDIKLKANYVIYDSVTEDLWAVGGCRLQEKGGEISGESLYYNVKRKDFRLENGSVFQYAQPILISGQSINRYGLDQYEGENIEFTPCLGTPPAWSLAAGEFEAPLEKYGNATHVKFQIRQLPLFYFPYLYFPVKIQRQSGFLLPSVSNSTDYGYRVGLPYYQVLSRSSDATFTPTVLTRRGLLLGAEYRYRLDTEQHGEIYGEVLPDDSEGGDPSENTVLDTIPDSRWLFRSFQTGGKLTWDVKLVSSPDYFRDVGSMYPNENIWRDTTTTSSSTSSTGVGRSLEELVSRGQWMNSFKGFSANVSGVWKQDLTVESNSQTLQEIPRATIRMNQRAIPGSPAFVSSEWTSSYVYSRDWIKEFKDNGQVKLFVPLTLYPYFTLTPAYTQYYRDAHITSNPGGFQDDTVRTRWESRDSSLTANYDDPEFLSANPGLFDKNNYQELWERRDLTLSTTLYSTRFLDGLYHQLVPTAAWTYFSRQGGNYDPGDVEDIYPQILPGDVWEQEHKMTLSLDNYIRDRSGKALAQLALSRVYDYLLEQWAYYEASIIFEPVPWFSLRHLNRFGTEGRPLATIEHWTRLGIRDSRGDELYASEEYLNGTAQDELTESPAGTTPDSKNALLGFKAALVTGLTARYEVSYDFLLDRYIRSKQGVTYTAQCWNIEVFRDVDTSDDNLPRNTTVGVTVNLLGLGQVIHTERSVSGQDGL